MILLDVAKKLVADYGYEGVPVADVTTILRDGTAAIVDMLEEGGVGTELTIPKFGKFFVTQRNARTGRNPKTGEKMDIPAKASFKFKTSSTVKNRIEEIKLSKTKPKEKKAKKKK